MDVAATLLTCDGLFTEVSGFGNQCNSLLPWPLLGDEPHSPGKNARSLWFARVCTHQHARFLPV